MDAARLVGHRAIRLALESQRHEFQQALGAMNLLTDGDDPIGFGVTRLVYRMSLRPDCVLKVEYHEDTYANRKEWEVWSRIKDTPYAKWFAPCVAISDNGVVMVQQRTVMPMTAEYPKRLPAFLTDFKRSNYGMLVGTSGRNHVRCFVCHDYASNLLMEVGMTDATRYVKWRKD